MIAAVVAVVDDNEQPPPELSLAWDVRRWGTLPEGGGLYDQDAIILFRMSVCLNIYDAVSRLRNMHGAQIHQLTQGERKIIGMLRREQIL